MSGANLVGTALDSPWELVHGFLGDPTWAHPIMTAQCSKTARPGYDSLEAHEYADTPEVLKAKVALLANLLRASQACTLYTGAGISVASGIADYATKAGLDDEAKDPLPPKPMTSMFEVQPTLTHRTLTALYKKGHVAHWVQQNHDGLPQKAGFPQHVINEIHGAWFDPSNPVVPMSGNLRTDLFEWLLEWQEKADLVLAMGTSLSGMNADRMVLGASQRAQEKAKKSSKAEEILGAVIISIQRTKQDDKASLRIFAKVDDLSRALIEEMSLEVDETWKYTPTLPEGCQIEEDVFQVPIDPETGLPSKDKSMILDLRDDKYVKITTGVFAGDFGQVVAKNKHGHYKIKFMHEMNKKTHIRAPLNQYLGSWWIEAAANGKGVVPGGGIPIVSVNADQIPEGHFPD
eukprot:TRINITY_DN8459_c0_g2_i1.p1 TRINITY_DN8459_c0_g2~~TRINITY_DN8459_c0_g2_i1.p1  ORF type:complete len:404 (-),score=116.59 TRINITY_DN8459_c0_g2_i1:262-1473(-)